MNGEEEIWEQLDRELDHCVVDMKPYVLKLQHSSERQRCALWIKKLCEPSGAGTGVVGRKNRNLHAKLLLHMLKRGVLEGPFAHKPEPGRLKTLPSYMSIYFDEPSSRSVRTSSPDSLPDWVVGELGNSESKYEESWKTSSKEESFLATPLTYGEKLKHNEKPELRSHSRSPPPRTDEDNLATSSSDHHHQKPISLDDSDLEARLHSWNLGLENPRYLREKPVPVTLMTPKIGLGKSSSFRDQQAQFRMYEKELQIKMKVAEGKFHEEKLTLQQKHDAEVQKILDRKNDEIEALKSIYKTKQNEAEEMIRKLQKKVEIVVRELQVVREAKEKQIEELKKMCEQSNESLNNEWEKRLHNSVAEMEKKNFTIQKQHTENMQQLLEDTTGRLRKMEEDYLEQLNSTNQTVKELEARVQQLTVEVENSNLQRQKLSQEKTDAEQRCQTLGSELQALKARYSSLQKDKDHVRQEYEDNIQQLQSKYDAEINFIKQEHAHSAAKASDRIAELQSSVSLLKQQLQDAEDKRQKQLRDQEHKFQEEKHNLERASEKQIHDLRNGVEKEREDAQKKIRRLGESLKEKEEQLTRVTEVQRLQAQQADAALEEFKRQVELKSEKVYAEMKQQMEQVEADLSRSKLLREKQSKEFSWQLEEVKQRYEQQIVELKLEREQEKTHLFQQHKAEKDCLVRDHQREMEKQEKQLRAAMAQLESTTQECRKQDGQVICDLENKVLKLREERVQWDAQRKQQLLELRHQWEEEKQKAAQDHEAEVNKLKAEAEIMTLHLKKLHALEMEKAVDKANSRLKQTEEECSQKLAKSSQIIAELKKTLASLSEERSRQQRAAEQRLQEVVQKFEDKKQQLVTDNDRAIKALQDEVDTYRIQAQAAEKLLRRRELEVQEQVLLIRQEYEATLKGLLPASLRQEFEDTILSLKSQVNILQNRVSLLQEERDACHAKR
ncbi:centrosomal protein of 112 kDa isoform X1 [Apus apus]|uniref:centrosomal protein of 112 kDa isoform X1 n=1 Tax=Apus apus TaxID=8895 RepID=UPI0021F88FF8|nr:centrosomal protein of 112 kDa isoform X1 [Apus apus]XP_051490533.1 centrosomal protein of 112 kDa isoform X1 [Apus apus]XP_051490534.1 centrosomal protein of 112 kDa isoform X1 [Apus apus]